MTPALRRHAHLCWRAPDHSCFRVPLHPGGPLIYVAAGKDCTQLFDAYHPLHVRRVAAQGVRHLLAPAHPSYKLRSGMLPKYCIGDLALAPGEAPPTTYEDDLAEGQFYHTLKKRVDAYFRDHKARFREEARAQASSLLTALFLHSWTRARTRPCLSRRPASCRAWL